VRAMSAFCDTFQSGRNSRNLARMLSSRPLRSVSGG
jgi:hypothetical protein